MKKLKLPLWSDIAYLVLTIVVPIVFILVEAYKVPSDGFRATFTVCCAALITYVMIKKFVLTKYLDKLSTQCSTIELNYQTGVGDPEKNKTLWVKNKIIEYVFNILQLVLLSAVILLIIWGVQSLGLKLKGTLLFIFILYIVSFAFRIVMYVTTFYKKDKNKTDEEIKKEQK